MKKNKVNNHIYSIHGINNSCELLNSKKVDSCFIGNAIEAYDSWTENAENELKKKFKGIKPTDYQSTMKRKQFLFNRGFTTQIIERIL